MRTALLCIAAMTFACGGSSGVRSLSVGGSYDTKVALLPGATCSAPVVRDNPTDVAHTPGAGTLTLTHAGTTYSGTITQTGAFSIPGTAVGGGAFTISIAGQFSAMGFTAITHVGQAQPSCSYDVSWVGTKTGPPNTFP